MLKAIKDICKLFLKAGWAALIVWFISAYVVYTGYGRGTTAFYLKFDELFPWLRKILTAFFLIGFVGYIATSIVEGVKAEKDKKK